jgi:Sodium:neurotransmitter symporter family
VEINFSVSRDYISIFISSNNQKEQLEFVKKDKWGKDIEFLLSCIALSVGLGNVWRFPFVALGMFVIKSEIWK